MCYIYSNIIVDIPCLSVQKLVYENIKTENLDKSFPTFHQQYRFFMFNNIKKGKAKHIKSLGNLHSLDV